MSAFSVPRRELLGVAAVGVLGLVAAIVILVTVLGEDRAAEQPVGGVDLAEACAQQYPGEGRVLVQKEAGNPYTWACESSTGDQGGIEVSTECARLYGPGVYGSIGGGGEPGEWYCVSRQVAS